MSDTKSYLDLVSASYGVLVDATATANTRMLEGLKSGYEIVSRPYASTAVESTYRENFDRAGQLVELGVTAAQKNGAEMQKLAETLTAQATEWQEKSMEAMQGLFRTSMSNLSYVKDAADSTFEGFTKRIEEIQARATVSTN